MGLQLVPPIGNAERVAALGPLRPTDVALEGRSWSESTTDLAVAGGFMAKLFVQHTHRIQLYRIHFV